MSRPDDALARGIPRDPRELPGAVPRPTETWLRICQVHERLTRRLDSALHRQHGISLAGFETLRRLAETSDERAPVNEVADALGLSRAAGTSTVDRLVAHGLVLRERAEGDEHLLSARLTAAGQEKVRAATATHDELVAHLLTLLQDDAAVVTDALARVSAAARSRR
ncbi:MAG: Transcriptional regulator, MarR family [Blastococcus sp.]|nr:Transcriptional regulator, MarR family [Blastococcus sp.]